ncbi:MAG: RdgB/HAM1 family non-canonical purine NTP pyrophosphatase [Planctomycetota bacterium]|nr:RdgB/HAM1 family non-canonical purine NTP pyrophosphatase [Planctomycetota bacterium]
MTRLLVATTNSGKLAELDLLLKPLGYEMVSLNDLDPIDAPAEEGDTFAENARSKALYYATSFGLPTLADDSGLEVRALGGAPGVRSARFAGEESNDRTNLEKLVNVMADQEDREAHFTCAICLTRGDHPLVEVQGQCDGRLAKEPRGNEGFGYDPLFIPHDSTGAERTFGEMSREEKQSLSHRGCALASLLQELAELDR